MVSRAARVACLMALGWSDAGAFAQAGAPSHPAPAASPAAAPAPAAKPAAAPAAAAPVPGAKPAVTPAAAAPVSGAKPATAPAAASKPPADAGKAKILEVTGSVMVNNAPVKVNAMVPATSDFKTGIAARVKVQLADGRTQMVMGAETEVAVKPKGKSLEAEVRSGISRWIVSKAKEASAEQPEVRTRTAIMGIRGTEFFVISMPVFNETEIACVEGTVEMIDANVPTDKKLIQKNQWGGIGGRFGTKLAPTLTLNPSQMEIFNKKVPKGK